MPFLYFGRLFVKRINRNLVIQTAKIGDYSNSSIIFEPLISLDLLIDRTNLSFAKHDERIKKIYVVNDYKKGFFTKLWLAFMIYSSCYERVYVLLPNSFNLFLARFAMAKSVVSVMPDKSSFSVKLLSLGFKKIYHSTNDLTLLTYLKMLDINELRYKKCIQKPILAPKLPLIKNDGTFKVGISFSAANKIKTPPPSTWQSIFDILAKFECEVYIFGIKDDDKMLNDLNTNGLKVTSLVDKISLENLPYEISRLCLYISSDTGNYYIADTMDVSTICLMGPCFASEQRGVGNTLIISPDLPPFTSVFATITDRSCPEYYFLSISDLDKIYHFIHELYNKSKSE